MSVKYVPVQWNRNKWFYDAALVALTGAYLWIFLRIAPDSLEHARPVDGAIRNARAFGTSASARSRGSTAVSCPCSITAGISG